MPQPIPEDKMEALTSAVLTGRKIEAIKLYRESTGVGLKEAKEEIEKIEAELRTKFPDQFAARPAGKGCFGAAAVLCVGAVSVAYWWVRPFAF